MTGFFFFFFLSNWMHFIYFSCLIAVERTSNTMLNRCDESGHSHLIPDFREKPSSFCNQDVSCDFVINNLYIAEIYSFYTNFDKSLFLIMNGWCLILPKVFSVITKMIIWFLFFTFINVVLSHWLNMHMLNHPWINPMIKLYHSLNLCWIQLANISLRIFTSMFISNIVQLSSFFGCIFCQGNCVI